MKVLFTSSTDDSVTQKDDIIKKDYNPPENPVEIQQANLLRSQATVGKQWQKSRRVMSRNRIPRLRLKKRRAVP